MKSSLTKSPETQTTMLERVAHVLHAVAPIEELEPLLNQLPGILGAEFELSRACLLMVDGEEALATLRTCSGGAGHEIPGVTWQVQIDHSSIVGAALAHRRIHLERHSGEPLACFEGFVLAGPAAVLPLAVDKVVGALVLQTGQAWAFQDEDIPALQMMAGQIAIAIRTAEAASGNRELLRQMSRRERLLSAGNKVGKEIASVLDLKALMPKMVDTIVEEYGFYYAGVFLLDESSAWATLRAGYGKAGEVMLAQDHKLQVGGNSMIGTCIRLNEACIALDVGKEPVRFKNPLLPDTRSEMALPLAFGGKVLGALTIQSVEENAFTADDITTLQTMADHLAVAIQNAYTLAALQDVSAELLRNKVYETLSEVVTEAIHWIGNKALPISMTVQRIKDALADGQIDPDLLKEDLDLIAKSAEQIVQAKEKIIGPARERKPRPVLLSDVFQAAAHQNGIGSDKLHITIQKAASHVIADSTQLTRVLGYLFLNAVEAGATRIDIKARPADQRGYVQIQVADDGSGMPREVRDRVWTPFFTTKSDHDGLGLPAALHVISQLHGNLYLTSVVGEGTELNISLPLSYTSTQAGLVRKNAPGSILLIDDDDDWARFFAGSLGDCVTRRSDFTIDPEADLILVDEHLEAASFEQVLEAARNARVISKVVVITAAYDVDRLTRTLRKGVRDVRLKPYAAEEFRSLWE